MRATGAFGESQANLPRIYGNNIMQNEAVGLDLRDSSNYYN